jgi:hypothetical protein
MSLTKIKKEHWVKGKSKYLEFRPELQHSPDYSLSQSFKLNQIEQVGNNQVRRANMKINQEKHSVKFYKDCFVNSQEYKDKHKISEKKK